MHICVFSLGSSCFSHNGVVLCVSFLGQDKKEMIFHHCITICLIYFSWTCNFVRVGTLVLVVHDIADPWVAVCTPLTSTLMCVCAHGVSSVLAQLIMILSHLYLLCNVWPCMFSCVVFSCLLCFAVSCILLSLVFCCVVFCCLLCLVVLCLALLCLALLCLAVSCV